MEAVDEGEDAGRVDFGVWREGDQEVFASHVGNWDDQSDEGQRGGGRALALAELVVEI